MTLKSSFNAKVLLAVILVSGTLLPALFGRPPTPGMQDLGDSWRNFIFNYQSLIAGYGAIAAALWTISAMRKSDEAQEARHRQTISVQMLSATQATTRLAAFLPHEIRSISANIRNWLRTIPAERGEPDWSIETVRALKMAVFSGKRLKAILANPRITACESLFTPRVADNLDQCKAWQEAVDDVVPLSTSEVFLDIGRSATKPEWYHEALVPMLGDLSVALDDLAASVEEWAHIMIGTRLQP